MGPPEPPAQLELGSLPLRHAWLASDQTACWRVCRPALARPGAAASSLVYFELDPGCRLARHRDSADELLVVLAGRA